MFFKLEKGTKMQTELELQNKDMGRLPIGKAITVLKLLSCVGLNE